MVIGRHAGGDRTAIGRPGRAATGSRDRNGCCGQRRGRVGAKFGGRTVGPVRVPGADHVDRGHQVAMLPKTWAKYNSPAAFRTMATPVSVKAALRMFARWPAEAIQPLTTEAASE